MSGVEYYSAIITPPHEENKRHCEAAKLVHAKAWDGGVSQPDLHRSPNTTTDILQLVEPIPATRPRRIAASVREPHTIRTTPTQTIDEIKALRGKMAWCPHKIAANTTQTSRAHDRLPNPTLLRAE